MGWIFDYNIYENDVKMVNIITKTVDKKFKKRYLQIKKMCYNISEI